MTMLLAIGIGTLCYIHFMASRSCRLEVQKLSVVSRDSTAASRGHGASGFKGEGR